MPGPRWCLGARRGRFRCSYEVWKCPRRRCPYGFLAAAIFAQSGLGHVGGQGPFLPPSAQSTRAATDAPLPSMPSIFIVPPVVEARF